MKKGWLDFREIKASVRFEQVLEHYGIELRPAKGSELLGLCPFHEDTKPSFRVNTEKRVYHCFGCDAKGNVLDFVMNDKCAAGTGRFLEVMARTLEIELEDMGELSLSGKDNVSVSSLCTVFAESEVVSLVGADHKTADICRGLHISIAKRITAQVKRIGLEEEVVMTGGVAKNIGVVKELERNLGCKIRPPHTLYQGEGYLGQTVNEGADCQPLKYVDAVLCKFTTEPNF